MRQSDWLHRWRLTDRHGSAGLVFGVVAFGLGCGPSTPTETVPPQESSQTDTDEIGTTDQPDVDETPVVEPKPVAVEPALADESTSPDKPAEPQVADGPVAGDLDGQRFDLAQASLNDTTLAFTDSTGRVVTVAIFGSTTDAMRLIDDVIPFGSPHIYVKPGRDAPPAAYTEGYRMLLDVPAGTIWLELPDERGLISGHFVID